MYEDHTIELDSNYDLKCNTYTFSCEDAITWNYIYTKNITLSTYVYLQFKKVSIFRIFLALQTNAKGLGKRIISLNIFSTLVH